ncbi:hypothetical protein GCM10027186_00130 [Micromonospora schwarzwaldensis]
MVGRVGVGLAARWLLKRWRTDADVSARGRRSLARVLLAQPMACSLPTTCSTSWAEAEGVCPTRIAKTLLISIDRDYALGPALRWITSEVLMRKMTIRRTTALRLVSGARRLWIEWCW